MCTYAVLQCIIKWCMHLGFHCASAQLATDGTGNVAPGSVIEVLDDTFRVSSTCHHDVASAAARLSSREAVAVSRLRGSGSGSS